MRRRVPFLFAALLFAVILLPSIAAAQLSFTTPSAPPTVSDSAVDDLLVRGRQLETERRWGEALTLYEDALRQYPSQADLEQRLQLSRIHYDVGRRYSDHSFCDMIATLPKDEAVQLFGEVLLKVQSHYVTAPDWNKLLLEGSTGLDVALVDSAFLERNLAGVPQGQINRFRRDLRTMLGQRRAASRQQAADVVSETADWANRQLGLSGTVTVMEFACSAVGSLDPYSTYLTSAQLNEVYSQIEGNFVGLGIELKSSDGSLLIVKVIPDSPAAKGGIKAGDRIIAVDGRSTRELNTDQAANMLQGKEGTTVEVTAVTPNTPPRRIRIKRERVDIPSVAGVRIIDETFGIGYLKLTCFQKTTTRDLDAALWSLYRQGMKSLVIDLRDNPGGLLTTSVDVVDKFVDKGVIVSTRGRSPSEDFSYSAHQQGTWRVPLVVLINGDSASASEIFAGAIRDHGRGIIVGSRSYGKGSVQGIFPLQHANVGLRLTTAKFYSPSGRAYSAAGVDPDVVVQEVAKPVSDESGVQFAETDSDAALDAALGVARRELARR